MKERGACLVTVQTGRAKALQARGPHTISTHPTAPLYRPSLKCVPLGVCRPLRRRWGSADNRSRRCAGIGSSEHSDPLQHPLPLVDPVVCRTLLPLMQCPSNIPPCWCALLEGGAGDGQDLICEGPRGFWCTAELPTNWNTSCGGHLAFLR